MTNNTESGRIQLKPSFGAKTLFDSIYDPLHHTAIADFRAFCTGAYGDRMAEYLNTEPLCEVCQTTNHVYHMIWHCMSPKLLQLRTLMVGSLKPILSKAEWSHWLSLSIKSRTFLLFAAEDE